MNTHAVTCGSAVCVRAHQQALGEVHHLQEGVGPRWHSEAKLQRSAREDQHPAEAEQRLQPARVLVPACNTTQQGF
jgi:hypothetical protein